MVELVWNYKKVEQKVILASIDDAKTYMQALWSAKYSAGYHVLDGHVEPKYIPYEGDGHLSKEEFEEIKARVQSMKLVR